MTSKRPAETTRVLWLSWKDRGHPAAGGAEVVLHQLIRRLSAEGHAVTLLTAAYPGAPAEDTMDGARVIRRGSNRYLHSAQALGYYWRHLRGHYDVVVEVVNTAPYFAVLAPGPARPVLLYHQLARQVWFEETRPPLSYFGYYVLEPLATRLLARSKSRVLSVSDSTSRDLRGYGFKAKAIYPLTEGIAMEPAARWDAITKYGQPTLLSLGSIRGMKRTLEQIKAFELARQKVAGLRLKLAGGPFGAYGTRVLDYVAASPYKADIEVLGKVSEADKRQLMGRCHLILVTSVKEGWGLIVSEANSQGTPAVVYDADGLRDSVKHGRTGLVSAPTPAALAGAVVGLLDDAAAYTAMRQAAYAFSRGLTFDAAYADFKQAAME